MEHQTFLSLQELVRRCASQPLDQSRYRPCYTKAGRKAERPIEAAKQNRSGHQDATARSPYVFISERTRLAALSTAQAQRRETQADMTRPTDGSRPARGASIFKMADQSRHKSMDTLRGYVRDAEIFRDHAGRGLL
jgi:hypothetical protein